MRATALALFAATAGLFVSLGAPAGAAPVPKHLVKEADSSEQGKLQGRWKLESISLANMPVPVGGKELEMTLEIRGDTLTATTMGRVTTAKVKIDAADGLKRLAATNIQTLNADGKPIGKEDDAAFGYTLEGDKLVLASNIGGTGKGNAADPAKPGDSTAVMVLTRIKDKN